MNPSLRQANKAQPARPLPRPSDLPFRQIHLDFHTSESIGNVAAEFDPGAFAETLKAAHVQSVTCFARCHHGWVYYDSKLFPERIHPHLMRRNLLLEQIRACHEVDMKAPVYLTVQWDHFTAEEHPEWLVITPEGKQHAMVAMGTSSPYEPGFYRYLCLNSPYRKLIKAQIKELFSCLKGIDGFFFDIVIPQDCSCKYCRQAMLARSIDASVTENRIAFGFEVVESFKAEISRTVREFSPTCSVFYNTGHIAADTIEARQSYSHFEIESLPSGQWGYLHFPLVARYARTHGLKCVGMTGKFHTEWGDFHSFKNRAALEYECNLMLALNCRCSIGDQLHPSGKLCAHTYSLIGQVFGDIEAKEPWCEDATAVTDVAVLIPEAHNRHVSPTDVSEALFGAVRMLQELFVQFDVIDLDADFSKYKVLVLPDDVVLSPQQAGKVEDYLAQGGRVIASHKSGMRPTEDGFAVEAFGVGYLAFQPYSPDFILPRGGLMSGMSETEHVMYLGGMQVECVEGEILGDIVSPYFNRTHEHFCSHRHTPSSGEVASPAAVKNGNSIYFAHPVFAIYDRKAPLWCKTLIANALDMLLPDRLIKSTGPSTLRITLNEQKHKDRLIVHLLHYVPERRGRDMDIVEDVIPLYNTQVSLQSALPCKALHLVPSGRSLEHEFSQGRLSFVVPEILGHQMVEVQF